mmetsp:Transcript_90988/g.254151  ORF Transcript_90988/g.254151 Transcript_90988/m.254151 type:complete len:214 (+) Transcript_90988:431-1072(+)
MWRGLLGFEMSALCSTVSSKKSLRWRAFCCAMLLSEASDCIIMPSSISWAKLVKSWTFPECLAMSVARTMRIMPFRTYCCKLAVLCASSEPDSAWTGASFASIENQSQSSSDWMVSNAKATCMFSKIDRSLYRTANDDIVFVWNKLLVPGCPTSWTAAAARAMKWSRDEVRSLMNSDCISQCVVAVTSAAWAATWYKAPELAYKPSIFIRNET